MKFLCALGERSPTVLAFVFVVGALLATSCTKKNPNYCDGQLCDQLQDAARVTTGADATQSDTDAAAKADAASTIPAADANEQPPAADATIDPACPTETHACVPAVPEGWAGPTVHADYAAEAEPVVCPGAFSASAKVYNSEIEAGGSCECRCGVASSVSCTAGTVQVRNMDSRLSYCYELAPCYAHPPLPTGDKDHNCPPETVELQPNSCINLLNQRNWEDYADYDSLSVRMGRVGSSSCNGGKTSAHLEAPAFTQRSTVCTAQTGNLPDACSAEAICAPKVPENFTGHMCIFKEGKHECPADSAYSEHKAVFSSLQDNRSCPSSCRCELEAGSSCGKVVFSQTLLANGRCVDTSAHEFHDGCRRRDFVPRYAHYVVDPAEHQCSPAGPVPVQGEAVGVGEVTLCCMPEADDS